MKEYEQTQQQLQALVQQGIVPGISYLIFDHQRQFQRVIGLAEVTPQREKLRSGMQYDLASLTKVIGTVPVIMQLMQRNLIHLDDPVSRYLPTINSSQITVRNLLTHTSGLHGYIPHRDELPANQLKQAFLHSQTVDDSWNRQIRYADVNFLYLGWIIERITELSVAQAIQQFVSEPLGMTETTYHPVVQNTVPTAIQPDRGLIRGQVHDPKGYLLGEHCGCAGLFSTLADLTKYSRALIETNLNGLLSEQLIRQLFMDQTLLSGSHSRSLGWKLFHDRYDRHCLISHTGFTGTWLVLDRQQDQGMIVLTNRVHPTGVNDAFLRARDRIFATYLKEK